MDAEMWISAVAEDQLCGLLVYRCDSFVEADIRPASGLGFLMRGLGPAMAQVLHLHICKGTVPTAGSSPGVGGEISLCQQVGKWSRRSASQLSSVSTHDQTDACQEWASEYASERA